MRIVLMMLGLVSLLMGEEIHWNSSFEAAKAAAQNEKKILYVIITSETCRWCRKLESTTLKKPAVVKNINTKYAPVALTRGKDSYPSSLKAKMVPMSYFLTPQGRVIYSVPGYWVAEDYLSMMDDVERKYKKQKKTLVEAKDIASEK